MNALYTYLNNLSKNTSINAGNGLKVYIKQTWGGIYENVSPTNLPDFGLTNVVNGIGQGTYIEKFPTVKKLGIHGDDTERFSVLRLMDFYDLFGRYHLLKICVTPTGNRIYEIVDNDKDLVFKREELIWSDITADLDLKKGEYNWAMWRNQLYIVSGNLFQQGELEGGVLQYNPVGTQKWTVINTGNSASPLPTSTGDDGASPFLPKTIAFHKDEMYLANDFQVKKAEHSNPENVNGSISKPFLGLLDTPPVVADLLRPSTFIPSQNGDKITALFSTNNFLWIITNRRFYASKRITVLDSQLPAGLLWMDTRQEHKVKTGTYSQKTIMWNDEQLEFLTTNQIVPTLASIIPVVSQDRTDKIYVANSTFIADTMKNIDWSEASIGVLGYGQSDSTNFISGKICNSDVNNITIAYKKFGDNIFFSKLYDENGDNWKANDWLNNDYTTMYGSSVNGDVYLIDTENYGDYDFTVQTGKCGVASGDSQFSDKILDRIWFNLYASKGMKLKIQIFKNPNCNSKDCDCEQIFETIIDVGCVDDTSDCINPTPFSHRKGFNWLGLLNVSSRSIKYQSLDMRLTAIGDGYFALHEFGQVYKPDSPLSESITLKIE